MPRCLLTVAVFAVVGIVLAVLLCVWLAGLIGRD